MDKTEAQKELIVKQAFEAFGIDPDMRTDPLIVVDVLKEMRLNDLKIGNRQLREFVDKASSHPQSISHLYNEIKHALVSKHPAVLEFAELAIEKKWLSPSLNIKRAAHVAYVLEAFTAVACSDHKFLLALERHIRRKELEIGLNKKHLVHSLLSIVRISHRFFYAFKAAGVDPFMSYFRMSKGLPGSSISKKRLQDLYKDKKINYLEYRLLAPTPKDHMPHSLEVIDINIYEAGITEYESGFSDNALCANELCRFIQQKKPHTFIDNKHFFVMDLPQDWCSLYVTWNMAFVLSELEDLDLVFPKLIIPSLINAKPDRFMGARIISLWLTMNFEMLRTADGQRRVPGSQNRVEMALAWGRINRKYAIRLGKEINETSSEVVQNYRKTFSHPVVSFIRQLINF